MLEAIYASKLYRGSARKDSIRAAAANPLNLELVTQLSSYLDDEYRQVVEEKPKKVSTDSKSPEGESNESESIRPSENSGGSSSGGSSHFSSAPKLDDGTELFAVPQSEEDLSKLEESIHNEPEPAKEEAPSEDVETSTEVFGEETVVTIDGESVRDVMTEISTIKNSLNSIDTTAGVQRIQVKDNEIWIYYNDDINLNNIMTDVIEWIDNAGYTYLEFNRLARSDNAIVFESSLSTSSGVQEEHNNE